jgi:hypothetical protein
VQAAVARVQQVGSESQTLSTHELQLSVIDVPELHMS